MENKRNDKIWTEDNNVGVKIEGVSVLSCIVTMT